MTETGISAFPLVFFILGWAYYMVATILMKGSIFTGMRMGISRRAETSRPFAFLRNMLGCLMCTATESALWTLGVSSFILGFHYRIPSHLIGILAGRVIVMPAISELFLALGAAFALSLAVAGEAWGIKMIVENRDEKFLALRNEYRSREMELLSQIAALENSTGSTKSEVEFQYDLT